MALSTIAESTGITGQSRNAYANLLKEYYADLWDLHVHTEVKIMSIIGKKKGVMGGKRVVAAVVDELPQSSGVTANEGVHLPTPRVGNYLNSEILSRGIFTRLRWTVEVELAARAGNKAAWARPRKIDVEHARKMMDINLAIKMYMGAADVRGVVASHAVSTTSVLTMNARNGRNSSGAAFWYSGRHYLRRNMSVGLIDTLEGALGDAAWNQESSTNEIYITAVGGTNAAPTVTLSDDITNAPHSFTPASGDYVTPHANRRFAGNLDGEVNEQGAYSSFNGIPAIAMDATIHTNVFGVLKSTAPTFNGVYDTNSGVQRPFAESQVMLLVDRIHDEGTGNSPDCFVVNRAIRREVVREHDGDRRYAPVQTESGFGKLVAHVGDEELPYESDWNCPPGMVVAVNKDSWGWATLADQQPVDQSLERWVADYAQHEILWHKHGNLYNTRPYDNGVMDDLQYDMFALT